MARYSIADFTVDIQNKNEYLEHQCREYIAEKSENVDFSVFVTDEEIRCEREKSGDMSFDEGYIESVCAYRKLCLVLPMRDAMLMHASVISCEDRGIAFLARSGVGKTTHTLFWKEVFGEKVSIINGDKPIIRFFDGQPYAYGTPWAGKENLQKNERVLLTDICFIERSDEDSAELIKGEDFLNSLMNQLLMPSEPLAALKTLGMVDKLLKNCRFWLLKCTKSQDSAILAYNKIFGEVL